MPHPGLLTRKVDTVRGQNFPSLPLFPPGHRLRTHLLLGVRRLCMGQNTSRLSRPNCIIGCVLANYRRLFAVPHVLSLLCWSLAARFYTPGLMIAVTFLVEDWKG